MSSKPSPGEELSPFRRELIEELTAGRRGVRRAIEVVAAYPPTHPGCDAIKLDDMMTLNRAARLLDVLIASTRNYPDRNP